MHNPSVSEGRMDIGSPPPKQEEKKPEPEKPKESFRDKALRRSKQADAKWIFGCQSG